MLYDDVEIARRESFAGAFFFAQKNSQPPLAPTAGVASNEKQKFKTFDRQMANLGCPSANDSKPTVS